MLMNEARDVVDLSNETGRGGEAFLVAVLNAVNLLICLWSIVRRVADGEGCEVRVGGPTGWGGCLNRRWPGDEDC